MPSEITLTLTQGKLQGQQYTFTERTTCIIGRSSECNIQLPSDTEHITVSRYHCLLDINPPHVRIRDFGSLNGTYVNGSKIGQRSPDHTPEQGTKLNFPEYDLQNQDKIKLGNTVFHVSIQYPSAQIDISVDSDSTNLNPPDAPPVNFREIIKEWLGLAAKEQQPELLPLKGYRDIKLLGKGGFGEVYKAKDENTGEPIAIKVMLPAHMGNQKAIQNFSREAENMMALSHPHVVKFKTYGYFQEILFLTMEYCNAGSVADLMEKYGGKLPINIAVPIILQILDGLVYTHSAEIPNVRLRDGRIGKGKGLVHRDLKPANMLLTRQGNQVTAKIADYGLAKAFDLAGLSGHSLTGTKAGSAGFMCRQQLLNFKYVQPEADVWAVAASLYNMLTGSYARNFTKDPLLSILENKPIPILERDANIPKKLAEVIDLGLVEKPQIHFKNAAAFKRALEFVYTPE
ncbi:serine/threonine-protein kinase [Anabaenopsis sp. FSS-46]|uniref:protein kinase domain-containing protein n=1 Tax=Anabaenopsis sp. FSS-46 TaxID=2971766 RepID=UPI0024731745|nr:protein kinase [Anabaenopsis sp. FSS-46]MDH6098023.1 serine/threonine-protein kinase [Anabaenopsis sp. FSS-46]